MNEEVEIFRKLDHVAEYRRRVEPLFMRVVRAQVSHLPEEGTLVEVGSGDGYLASHLPADYNKRVVLTEPTITGVTRLKDRFPKADIRRASAESLPFEDGSVAAIIGCCVLDVLPSLPRAFQEFARVLQPGGVVLHWLDMATDLEALFTEVVEESDLYALPNVFTDPAAASWPEDVMLVPRQQVDMIIEILGEGRHAERLRHYRDAFHRSPRDAVFAFSTINESSKGRHELLLTFRRAMKKASEAERGALAAFQGRPISSAQVFHGRVASLLPSEFDVLQHEIVRETAVLPRSKKTPSAYRSIVGYIQAGQVTSQDVADNERYVELGVHVYRAHKP